MYKDFGLIWFFSFKIFIFFIINLQFSFTSIDQIFQKYKLLRITSYFIIYSDLLVIISILFYRKQEVQFTSNLFAILGSKQNLSVHLDTLKLYTETKSMALIYVEEKLQNGMFCKCWY